MALPLLAILSLAGTAASAASDAEKAKMAEKFQKEQEAFAEEQRKAQYRNEFRSALGRAIGAGRESGFVPDNPTGPKAPDYSYQNKLGNIGRGMTYLGENGESMIGGFKGNYAQAKEANQARDLEEWKNRTSDTPELSRLETRRLKRWEPRY